MQALVIGCGYLGRRVAAQWLSRGHAVSALTRSEENAAALRSSGIEPVLGDILEPSSLRSLPTADIVLYAVGYDKRAGTDKRRVYVDGLTNVLVRIAPWVERFLYVSSTSVYGQDAGEWIDETSPCSPATEDGRICLAAEETIWSFLSKESNAATVVRLAGLYGPGRLLRRIDSLRSREPIQANPEAFLNLIHVDDAARIIDELGQHGRRETHYVLCDDRPVRRREYYSRLAELVGAPPPQFDSVAIDASRLNKRCSNARIRAELGDMFHFPTFETGLPQALASGPELPPR